ncbi:MAG: PAS domain S-box protein [Candidatus Schekmanbacteria bacterium]|nr:PAS domain S-box protein [Candidatus Schekmanbacteria bacterium]
MSDYRLLGKRFVRAMRLRYLSALGLLGVLAIFNYAGMASAIRGHRVDAEIVNISGRQRMLSQRIISAATMLVHGPPAQRSSARTEILEAAGSLLESQAILSNLAPATFHASSREAAPPLADAVRAFVARARALAELSDAHLSEGVGGGLAEQQAAAAQLLVRLDGAVGAYQAIADQRVAELGREHLSALLTTLVVLGALGLAVFRPMSQRVQHDVDRLVGLTAQTEVQANAIGRAYQELQKEAADRRNAQDALRETTARFRSLFNNSLAGLGRFELMGGTPIEANARLASMFGYPDAAAFVSGFTFAGHHTDPGFLIRLLDELEEDGDIRSFETRLNRLDGTEFWVRASLRIAADRGYFECVMIDITDWKTAEETLRLLAAAVVQSAESIFITSTDGAIQYVNPAFEQITGYSWAEVAGRTPRVLSSSKHDDAFFAELWQTITSGRVWTGRVINKAKDGTLLEEEETISPIRGEGGKISHFVAVKHNVTREVRLEAELQTARKLEAIGRLAGGVAHDFNNFLTIIMGVAALLAESIAGDDPRQAHVQEIQQAARMASNLVRQLLTFARRQVVETEVLDLNEVVDSVLAVLERVLTGGISVVKHLSSDLARVKADRAHVEQVILNLAVNAKDALPNGGTISITTANVHWGTTLRENGTSGLPDRDSVLLAVSDTGIGMDRATMSRIFEPFFTTKAPGHGTGLGLSTVYGIVKQLGGDIEVDSTLAEGTSFRVYLPCAAPREVAPARAGVASGGEGRATRKARILVVEDQDGLRNLVATVLKVEGYDVIAAESAEQALPLAGHHIGAIDLVLTDVIMPGVSGPELVAQLAARDASPRVLYMSGYTGDLDLATSTSAVGPYELLQKPFTPEELLDRVAAVLGATSTRDSTETAPS